MNEKKMCHHHSLILSCESNSSMKKKDNKKFFFSTKKNPLFTNFSFFLYFFAISRTELISDSNERFSGTHFWRQKQFLFFSALSLSLSLPLSLNYTISHYFYQFSPIFFSPALPNHYHHHHHHRLFFIRMKRKSKKKNSVCVCVFLAKYGQNSFFFIHSFNLKLNHFFRYFHCVDHNKATAAASAAATTTIIITTKTEKNK